MSHFSRALAVSVGLHILVLGGYFAFESYQPAIKLHSPSIQVSLTKLGQTRDPKLLPRLDVSEAPKQTPVPVTHTPHKTAPKITPKTSQNPLEILKKRFGKPTPVGHKEGSAFGTSLSSELANSYELQVLELLRANYEIPRVISPKEALQLKLWARLRISPRGKLIDIEIVKASQNPRFDKAVLEGSRKISSFGAPPLTLSRKYQTEGLFIQFCPLECL